MTTLTGLNSLTGDYVLDTEHTRIGFVARHTMATKVRGLFENFDGSVRLNGDDPSKSRVELTIRANSIQTFNLRRDTPLRTKFLAVDDHPTIAFTSTEVRQVDRTTFNVTGDLTIRGATKPVTVDFRLTDAENDRWGKFQVRFAGSAKINRKDWGVHWAAAMGFVSKTVIVELVVVATRRS